jgi:hypothetical protein
MGRFILVSQVLDLVKADQNGLEIYFYVNPDNELADSLKVSQRVTYHLAFTLFGPLAFDVTSLLL